MKNVLLGLAIAFALAVGASQASAAHYHGYAPPPRHVAPPVRYNAYRYAPYQGYRSYNYYPVAPRPYCAPGYGYPAPYRSYYGGGGVYLGTPGVSLGIGW